MPAPRTLLLLALSAVPAVAGPPSHCGERETTVFTCAVKAKVLSVCVGQPAGDPTYAQYHFGPIGAEELVYPTLPSGFSAFRFQRLAHMSGSSAALSFANGDVSYEVWSSDGKDAGGGVNIHKGGKILATVGCTGDYAEQWDHIAAHVQEGSVSDVPSAATASCADAASRYADHALATSGGQMDGVQQGEIHEAVKSACQAGWPAEVTGCLAGGEAPATCTAKLPPADKASLDAAIQAIFPG